uniref:hypothetical protein n=1 Tax=Pedobacter schmidteae TaxID=2201271 RepID=UPI000EB3360B|nr:hypothetical protein [Pedobacter schmidteae]
MKKTSDFIFIAVIGLLAANTIFQSIWYGNVLSLNNYVGFVLWIIITVLRFSNNQYRRYGLTILLFLSTLNIANLTVGSISFNAFYGDIESISVNPIMLLILIIYYIINEKTVKKELRRIFFPSEEEKQSEHQMQIDFYYRKFENCGNEELKNIIINKEQYPMPAQIALDKLSETRGYNL